MAIQGNGVQTMDPYTERLASFPEVPRRRLAGDGTEPQGPKGGAAVGAKAPTGSAVPPDQQAPNAGILAPAGKTLADADAPTIHRTLEQLVRSQDRLARNRWAIAVHYRRVRAGVPFSRLEKIPNQSIWVAKLPNGMSKESTAAVPNKADDLCNKVEDTLMADPPKPDPKSKIEDDATDAAAELAKEFLTLNGGEAGTNDIGTYRWALNNAFTGASSFLHYTLNRSGGGYQALQKLAHPQAQDPANPLVAMVPLQGAAPVLNPETGALEPAMIEDRTSNPVMRYVSPPTPEAPAGQFVEDAQQADRVWLPKIVIERMRAEQVRCFPPTATVEEADAIILIRWCTVAEARARWPKTAGQMDTEALNALASWAPAMAPEQVVPYAFRGTLATGMTGPSLDEVGSLSPLLQRRMFTYLLYVKSSPEYPGGFWVETSGANGGTELDRGDLEYAVTLPTAGTTTRCREIPAVQIRPMLDVDGGDPNGWPFISRFAGTSEATATLLAAFADVCDNMLHPHVFIRSTAAVDEDDWFDRLTPIILNPGDPEPTYERFPTLPPILPLVENLEKAADTSSGLTATAQGLDTDNSRSGVSKNLDIRQALISMSGFQQNLTAGMTRGWRITLQLVQAEYTTPQLIQYTGEEGAAATEWWTGQDLAGVDTIGLQAGTGTMMTPEGKAQYVAFLQGQGWLTPEGAAEIALPSVAMDLGLPEDPYKAAIERSIDAWLDGPPEGWVEQKTAQQQQLAMAEQAYAANPTVVGDGMGGAAAAPFTPPPMPELPNPFLIRPNDNEPAVALIYAKRLSKLFVDPKYEQQDQMWQLLPTESYQRAIQALTPPPTLAPSGGAQDSDGGDGGGNAPPGAGGGASRPKQPQHPRNIHTQSVPATTPEQAPVANNQL